MLNPRLEELKEIARQRELDLVWVRDPANLRALTGINCDHAVLELRRTSRPEVRLYTDFRYVPMVHRVAPELRVGDIRRLGRRLTAKRVGYESSLPHAQFLKWQERLKAAEFVDLAEELAGLRAAKTAAEQAGLRAAERLNCRIWQRACAKFRPGMTEREMARVIQRLMLELGDGEAFATIVCVGANAAECHHEPDDTVWNGREPVLVDMGVKFNGYCSDLTRNLVPSRPRPLYRQVYRLVERANRAAIAAARPGITCAALDRVARDLIAAEGFGSAFGHSLGHGVGLEIHEAPTVSRRSSIVLKPGMVVTIEPGVYLEGNLGVRIEDMILITESGAEVLSKWS